MYITIETRLLYTVQAPCKKQPDFYFMYFDSFEYILSFRNLIAFISSQDSSQNHHIPFCVN